MVQKHNISFGEHVRLSGFCRISQHKTTVQQPIDIAGEIIYYPSTDFQIKEDFLLWYKPTV